MPASVRHQEDTLNDDPFAWRHSASAVIINKYEVYCSESPLKYKTFIDPISILMKIAFDILLIPAMSAECKRIFSSAKHLLSDSQNLLSPETIEGVKCKRNWLLHSYGVE